MTNNTKTEVPTIVKRQLEIEDVVKLVFISLFAGCGGSSKGYHLTDEFKELLALEWDKNAREVFAQNFPDVPIEGWDISKVSGQQILDRIGLHPGELDVFDASPPCQDFSTSNTKRDPNTARNTLYFKTLDLIEVVQPKVFVIENVEGMSQGKMRGVWNEIVDKLQTMNYYSEFKVVKAEEHDVPQLRRRLIIIGVRRDIHCHFNITHLFPKPTSCAQEMTVASVLPNIMGYSPGQFQDRFHFADESPMCTITKTASAWVYDHNGFRRKPTLKELKVLSSFPEDFTFENCSINQAWARIGNAVPPNITKAIGLHIRNHILTNDVLEWCNNSSLPIAA